jgi:predicted nuclease of predicted toxin-antitoxin system
MKFLCDVHISYKVVKHLNSMGFKAVHVNEILDKWFTKDQDICRYADEFDFIVISKDGDFKNSYLINKTPRKFIKVNLGNIAPARLNEMLSKNVHLFEKLNSKEYFFVEIYANGIFYMS